MLVCKKRFFSVLSFCGVKETKEKEIFNVAETGFIVIVLALTIGVYFAGVSIDSLIEINGAVIGFFFIYFIPAAMHFKCLYIPTKRPLLELKPRVTQEFDEASKEMEMGDVKTEKGSTMPKENIVLNIEELKKKLD